MVKRCDWCGDDPIYQAYHDTEWGVPEWDGRALWEKLVLDGFQAGLSWITILRKRDAFRKAFDRFDPARVANFTEAAVLRLLDDPSIVRHRGKIESAIKGAQVFLEMGGAQAFSSYCWNWVDGRPIQNTWKTKAQVPAQTPLSTAFSKDLKKRGFNFCGPTIVYAWMQATGMVNDHQTDCHRYNACAALADRKI